MDFLETLREQKREGEREKASKEAELAQKIADDAARKQRDEDEHRRIEAERHRRKAEQVFATLPALIRQSAALGLESAVLPNAFVEDRQPRDKASKPIVLSRKTFYASEWLIPFLEMCQEHGVPLVIVSEQVNVGLKSILSRTFTTLAVDLKRL